MYQHSQVTRQRTVCGVDQPPLLVGWSYSGILAWHCADRHPNRTLVVVCVDAFPIGLAGPEAQERIRKIPAAAVVPAARRPV
ncbi:alpha/beta fold hydrolase, partial [Kibdelosporangium lantanae]